MRENREDERESIHLDISLLLYLFCCTLCYMLPSHIFQNSLIAASGVIENALIKYKMVTNTKSQFFEVQFRNIEKLLYIEYQMLISKLKLHNNEYFGNHINECLQQQLMMPSLGGSLNLYSTTIK